jgi:hypothetical protein
LNEVSRSLKSTSNRNPQIRPVSNLCYLPTRKLLTPRRLDIALKHRFFEHLLGGSDPEADLLYRWHIEERSGQRMRMGLATDRWKREVEDYVAAATDLLWAMKSMGFSTEGAVPVDPSGEILDGSHRVACALALRIKEIPVTREWRMVWAPPWDYAWFMAKGMSGDNLNRLEADFTRLAR